MMKTALVTGAAGGIGFAVVKQLLKQGIFVYGMDILTEESVKDKFSGFENFCYISGNLALTTDRKKSVSTIVSEKERIDILVNVAGVAPRIRNDLLEMSEESYDTVMGINTKGTMFLTQLVANQMIKQEKENGIKGYIVNISSCSAYTSSTSRGEYCISKAAVSMVTMLFADRLASEGIPVNEVCPGIIKTGMTAGVKEKYDKLIAGGLVPIARWGEPEDIAKAVGVLSDGSLGYTTGQSIIVDGGMHIRRL